MCADCLFIEDVTIFSHRQLTTNMHDVCMPFVSFLCYFALLYLYIRTASAMYLCRSFQRSLASAKIYIYICTVNNIVYKHKLSFALYLLLL